MSHDYKCWHKALSKELCEYMDCFESNPDVETLCIVEKLSKTMVKLYEMEAYEIMFDCLEDCFGYDRDEHEFEDKNGGGMDYVMFSIYNAYNPARMTRGTPHYPSTTGREYGTGVDRRYGERYNERSTDKSMYQPYGMDYGMGYGWMNAYDGDRNRMMDDRRTGERNGERNGDRNGNRDRDWDSRSGERGMERSRGRYMNAAERKDVKDKLHKLTDAQKMEWMDTLEEDGIGQMFTKEEVMAAAKKLGIKPDGYSDLDLTLVSNLMLSDYEDTAKKMNVNRLDFYVSLAKDFLEDEDSVDPEMKLAAYKKYIVEEDD